MKASKLLKARKLLKASKILKTSKLLKARKLLKACKLLKASKSSHLGRCANSVNHNCTMILKISFKHDSNTTGGKPTEIHIN